MLLLLAYGALSVAEFLVVWAKEVVEERLRGAPDDNDEPQATSPRRRRD